jgi:2-polyprenyl-3-methyl-5-hydroxy-6-metoxy-1,4-benzoquinol methylase
MSLHDSRVMASLKSGGVSSPTIPAAALRAAAALPFKPTRVLDYGAGVGRFTPVLQATYPDAKITGADLMPRPEALPETIGWLQGDLNHALDVADGAFDLIFSIGVIEHLENPRHMLRELFRMLSPGGAAVVTTPNPSSIRSLLNFVLRGHHAAFDEANYPAHITPVAAIDFHRAGTECGFAAPDFFFTDVGVIPKVLSRKWQSLPLVGKHLKGKAFSDNFGAVFKKP